MAKKVFAMLLAVMLLLTAAGCAPASEAQNEENPVIRIVMIAQATDLNEDPMVAKVKDITGYDIEFTYVSRDSGTEKLLLDLAGGEAYDICVFFDYASYSTVAETGALMDISDLLEQHGQNILTNVSDMAWETVTYADGSITGLPVESFKHSAGDLFGAITGGIAFRSNVLEEMGAELPTTLDEFYALCKAYLEKTGNAPIATKSADLAWNKDIASALGMGSAFWYRQDDTLVPRIRTEGFQQYIELLQKWYAEGIIDPDMPINSSENVTEKFLNTALCCTEFYFWNIPSVLEAVTMEDPEAEILISACLSGNGTAGTYTESTSVSKVYAIPKTSQHPEDAIKYMNILSDMDNFLATYLGVEGESFEIRDGNYYPLFPGFSDYANSDNFTGLGDVTEMGKMWQARARKTEEMAASFDQMNESANDLTYVYSPEGYMASLPAYREYYESVLAEINDIVITAIVDGTDSDEVVAKCISVWENDGGLEIEKEVAQWYAENSDLFS